MPIRSIYRRVASLAPMAAFLLCALTPAPVIAAPSDSVVGPSPGIGAKNEDAFTTGLPASSVVSLLKALYNLQKSGGAGSAVTLADGANATLGAKADDTFSTGVGTASVVSLLKVMANALGTGPVNVAGTIASSSGPSSTALPVWVANTGSAMKMLLVDASGHLLDLPQATENHLGSVGGSTVAVTASFTRPADANAYSALDAVSNSTSAPAVLTFSNAMRVSSGSGYLTKARLCTDQSTNTARYRLFLFSSATPTLINDNSPYTMLWSENAIRIGQVDIPALNTEGTGSTEACGTNIVDRIPLVASGSANVYGVLETLDSWTPASAENFAITLWVDQN